MSQEVKNARALVERLDYLHRKIRTHVAAGAAGVAGVPQGIGRGILREASSIAWALELVEDGVAMADEDRAAVSEAIDRHETFIAELPSAAVSPAVDRFDGAVVVRVVRAPGDAS